MDDIKTRRSENNAKIAWDSIDFQRCCAIQKGVKITLKEIPLEEIFIPELWCNK